MYQKNYEKLLKTQGVEVEIKKTERVASPKMLSKFSPVAGLVDAHRRSNEASPDKKTLPSLNMNPNMQKVLLKYAAQNKNGDQKE